MTKTVLVLGATGLFGGHLARQLIATGRFDVVCCGRSLEKLASFRYEHGGRIYAFDRTDAAATAKALEEIKPFAVVDTAGPFQDYGVTPYAFARAAIEAGAHYLDIADAPEFVRDIVALDDDARRKGVAVISGASSTPGLSSAVVDDLVRDLEQVDEINTAIIPGNKTPRGLAVMQAIFGQVGQPFHVFRHGRWTPAVGWSDTVRVDLAVPGRKRIRGRPASLVNTPDLVLFPKRYGARTVTFRAGLELGVFHHSLRLARFAVKWGWIRSLEPMSNVALRIASYAQNLGSDVGGMRVRVVGVKPSGERVRREWHLIASDGHGPKIPVQPVAVLLNQLSEGRVAPGARPCAGEVPLGDLETAMAKFGAVSVRHERVLKPLFEKILGADFARLAPPVRELHQHYGRATYSGLADIDGAEGFFQKLAARVAGFPPSARDVPVRVTIDADDKHEVWQREFGRRRFRSVWSFDPTTGRGVEKFWPFSFKMGLAERDGELQFPVLSGRLFGFIPLPRFLLPESETREYVDDEGRFRFEVLVRSRTGRRIAGYRGYLESDDRQPSGKDGFGKVRM